MAKLLLITFCCIITFATSQSGSRRLRRRDISDSRAVCNDNTAALFYYDGNSDTSVGTDKWIIYFEGGAGCSSREDCSARYNDQRNIPLMSSSPYRTLKLDEITGKGLMSPDPSENPGFHNFHHVYVPYCSSDAWLGANYNPHIAYNSVNKTGEFSFQGSAIFRGVITDLCSIGMNNSSDVILVGSSASGVGVLDHADWVQMKLNNTRVRLILESAWFINFDGVLSNMVSNEIGLLYNISHTDILSCLDLSYGYPCCLSPACHLMHSSTSTNQPDILFIFSQFDIYALQFIFSNKMEQFEFTFTNVLRLFNSYGSAMLTYANVTVHQGNLSFYIPSCAQHRYLIPSELWSQGGLLTTTTDTLISEPTFEFYNPLEPGITWRQVSIGHLNMQKAITQWYNNNTSFYLVDSCDGPLCNPTCPDSVVLITDTDLWSTEANIAILVLAALLTIACVIVKSVCYIYQIYILDKQKKFVENMRSKEDRGMGLQLENLLPSCTQYCSVSCVNLTYRPDMYKYEKDKIKGSSTENPAISKHKPHQKLSKLVNKNKVDNSTDPVADKTIIKDINLYFNPGELVAIMGPSGSGKTTLLDVLTGRRITGEIEVSAQLFIIITVCVLCMVQCTQGDIYINGISSNKMKRWFIENTGYVLQLANPFLEELTVRENLLFAVNMQLPKTVSWNQKLERVEQVIRETGLFQAADVTVGGTTGPGLSGGEKKRLSIAMQLLQMPNMLFLDEPTSGLDASSSLSLLKTLHCLAQSGRAIVLTIHQPRIEIFHMFDKILLICKGQVAYFGSPFKALTYFTNALKGDTAGKMNASNPGNPADAILDILTKEKSQMTVLRAYQTTGEPQLVQTAIKNAHVSDSKAPTTSVSRYPGLFLRLFSLESRASLRQTVIHIIYLPVVYCVFAFILGSVYFQTEYAVQIMSVTCLTSCSSSLFMSSIVMWLLFRPLEIFRLEHADGIASAHELVLQVFIRMSALCTGPLTVCSTAIFLSVYQQYDIAVYITVLLAFLLVNQAWLSMFILITCINPNLAHRICPLVASICGFCCGFIVPRSLMPEYYRWIFYINPSYYAYAATTTAVLKNINLDCPHESPIECLQVSGRSVLSEFGLDGTNPILCLLILMVMIATYITAAILVLQIKLAALAVMKQVMKCFRQKRHGGKVFALTGTANNKRSLNPANDTSVQTTKSKFLEMDEQAHEVVHHFKPKQYKNTIEMIKTSVEDDSNRQLKRHLSVLSSDSISNCSSEPSLIDMQESEAERFLRSVRILFNKREMMDEQMGFRPTSHYPAPIADKASLQALANGTPPRRIGHSDHALRKSPQKMFTAPNMSLPVADHVQNEAQHKQHQPHPLLLQPASDDAEWNEMPAIPVYLDSNPHTSQSTLYMHGRHSSIESLEMSDQL